MFAQFFSLLNGLLPEDDFLLPLSCLFGKTSSEKMFWEKAVCGVVN